MKKAKQFSPLPAVEKVGMLLNWLKERKARDMVGLDLCGASPICEMLIIATASSVRHGRSLADGLLEFCHENNFEFLRAEGYQSGMWILVDLNDVIVHIFQQETRELYKLETLWREAVELTERPQPHPATGFAPDLAEATDFGQLEQGE